MLADTLTVLTGAQRLEAVIAFCVVAAVTGIVPGNAALTVTVSYLTDFTAKMPAGHHMEFIPLLLTAF